LASLNVKGFGRADVNGVSDKWYTIYQIMREQKLAILAVQEAHLSPARLLAIESLFGEKLMFLASSDPEHDAGAGGIVFVINRKSFSDPPIGYDVVVPGRAALITMKWSASKVLRILNVYAPNKTSDNAAFWDGLRVKLHEQGRRVIDVVLGDFNVVEMALDRMPPHQDASGPVRALERLCVALKVEDSWRSTHAGEREFSYLHAATGSQSRIDRIYLHKDMLPMAADWATKPSGVVTDHCVVSLSLANYDTPETGRGRWKLCLPLLKDPVFIAKAKDLGLRLQSDIAGIAQRTDTMNAQTLLEDFKAQIRDAARARMKVKVASAERKIAKLREQLRAALNSGAGLTNGVDRNTDEDVAGTGALKDKIMRLEVERFGKMRARSAARDWVFGEKLENTGSSPQ
ncbi:Endonuclease/exonuclease/phosphatase, partial [Lenzites betulinus]